jgi:hypothetical protein
MTQDTANPIAFDLGELLGQVDEPVACAFFHDALGLVSSLSSRGLHVVEVV